MNRLIMIQLDYRSLTALACVSKNYREMVNDNTIWPVYPTRERRLDFKSLKATYRIISRASLLDIIKIKYPDEKSIEDSIRHRAFRILEYWLLESPRSFEGYYRRSTEQKRLIGRQLAELFYRTGRWEAVEMLARFGFSLKGRYSKSLNKAIYRDEMEEVKKLIAEGACPDPRAYNYALIENKTGILALLSGSGGDPGSSSQERSRDSDLITSLPEP